MQILKTRNEVVLNYITYSLSLRFVKNLSLSGFTLVGHCNPHVICNPGNIPCRVRCVLNLFTTVCDALLYCTPFLCRGFYPVVKRVTTALKIYRCIYVIQIVYWTRIYLLRLVKTECIHFRNLCCNDVCPSEESWKGNPPVGGMRTSKLCDVLCMRLHHTAVVCSVRCTASTVQVLRCA